MGVPYVQRGAPDVQNTKICFGFFFSVLDFVFLSEGSILDPCCKDGNFDNWDIIIGGGAEYRSAGGPPTGDLC